MFPGIFLFSRLIFFGDFYPFVWMDALNVYLFDNVDIGVDSAVRAALAAIATLSKDCDEFIALSN